MRPHSSLYSLLHPHNSASWSFHRISSGGSSLFSCSNAGSSHCTFLVGLGFVSSLSFSPTNTLTYSLLSSSAQRSAIPDDTNTAFLDSTFHHVKQKSYSKPSLWDTHHIGHARPQNRTNMHVVLGNSMHQCHHHPNPKLFISCSDH